MTEHDGMVALIEALQKENAALRKVLGWLRGCTACEHYHHEKRDRHPSGVPCPVEARIDALLGTEAPHA